ncbi:MAG: GerW family sporulation protein [Clostridia bacterium]
MAEQHPIEALMMTAMTSLESMIDVNTIVGDIVTSPDGTVIIPVSKVSFGFAAGGSEFNTNKLNKFSENTKLPFGGGSGAGVNISPMAFLIVKDGTTKFVTLNGNSPIDKLIDLIPDVINKANSLIEKAQEKPKQVLKVPDEENITMSEELD